MGKTRHNAPTLEPDPLWFKDAIIYQLHVKTFHDLNGDGMGDFRGLLEKLDYLQDLGVTALWLLPFYPSPLRDDGYDIADYLDVHPNYGTLADAKAFIREAHQRGMRVITELVVNHTSDQHEWFQRARSEKPGSRLRNYYVWNDTPDKYKEARIIFKDYETSNWAWDPVANAYYWHRFYSHQPDLNYENPEVRKSIFSVLDFWMETGVDGMRLDAVPYLCEEEGTNCENLPGTHKALKDVRRHVDKRFQNRMLLGEANQWPEDAVAYFGDGDECHMAFHFPLMPRIFMATQMEDRYPIIEILAQTPAIPENCQWAIFLRNHDELTLEMVTDEERDYMYRSYAHDPQMRINLGIRRRLAPLLGNDRRKIELMNGLLFSLPGTPVVYYGDELGMGDNVYLGDRNSVRTPMQWSGDRNAGFSRANSQRLYLPVVIEPDFHYESVNVEAQQNNPTSLLWWMKRIIALRKRYKAFSRGSLEMLTPENRKVLAYIRRFDEETILVVANLSRQAQYVELDLKQYQGRIPMELTGGTAFPRIGELTYLLTLGAHSFYWFSLEPERIGAEVHDASAPLAIPTLKFAARGDQLFEGAGVSALERLLPAYLRSRRWFGGKARHIQSCDIQDVIPLPAGTKTFHLLLTRVEYTEGDPEMYSLPVAFASGEEMSSLLERVPEAIVARLQSNQPPGDAILFSAFSDPAFASALLQLLSRRRKSRSPMGEMSGSTSAAFRRLAGDKVHSLEPTLMRAEQSNTSVLYGNQLILKTFRRLEEGTNPDLEIGRFLTDRAHFPHTPPVLGAIEYRRERSEPMTLGILQAFVPNEGDAWQLTLDLLDRYYEQALAHDAATALPASPTASLVETVDHEMPPLAEELIGPYLEYARQLGQCTAELHIALASDARDPAFSPEPFSSLYQRSIYQGMRTLANQSLNLLKTRSRSLPAVVRDEAKVVLELEARIQRQFQALLGRKITALRTRVHGDYHLGQVLFTGRQFIIIDFEGEPTRAISERRIKRSPLRDVSGMIRSFHYAAYTPLVSTTSGSSLKLSEATAGPWALCWYRWVSAAFLRSYLEVSGGAPFIPKTRQELEILLNSYLLEKALYELAYEFNHRPDWITLPIKGIRNIVELPE